MMKSAVTECPLQPSKLRSLNLEAIAALVAPSMFGLVSGITAAAT